MKPVHYLPPRAVVKESKTSSKVRIVYNGSSKASKNLPSLNDCLLKGPSSNPLIIELLLRLRLNPAAFVCNIQKAFLQISLKENERNVLHCLWVDDTFTNNLSILIYRFCWVIFGLTSSPFLLNATLREHFKQYLESEPEYDVIHSLMISLFVDDFIGDGDDVYNKFTKLAGILTEASFCIHKFISNDEYVTKRYNYWVVTTYVIKSALRRMFMMFLKYLGTIQMINY